MARKSKRNASRGSVNNIILETLYSGEKYGYEIIKEVEKKTDGKIVLKQPSLYSSLSRFESKNYVSSYWSDSEIGGKRHYYYLTDEGKKYYEDNVLNKKSEYDFLNDDYVPPVKEELEEDNNNSEEYNYDESENSDYSSSYNFNKYNFDVQDRMNELLGETTLEETTDDIEDYYTESDNVEDSIIEEELFTEDLEENIEDVFENDIEVNQSNTNQYDEEEVLQDKINSIHTAYSVDSETKPVSETIKYTNNLSKEISNVYNSIKSYNDIENKIDETDYIREQKKKDSMEVLYGTDIEENKNTSKYKFTNFSNDYYIDENGITRKRYKT